MPRSPASARFFGVSWVKLINHLRIKWTLNPQYGYGWGVSFHWDFLVWKKCVPVLRDP